MASTYPLEVVEAARWVKANPKVTGGALEEAMAQQSWDPSVKSLTAFSQVLEMMSDQLSWMQQLGDAFLAQQDDVLAAVQGLRAKADAEGTLGTTKEQTVQKQAVTNTAGSSETVIVIEPADPAVVYVPTYDPTVVYGAWAYPAYPPYYWYPPGYVASRALWFAAGVAAGHALWGGCDWGRGDVDIDINRYNSFNHTKITNAKWEHNSVHRKGVPYRDHNVAERYGKGSRDAKAREQFRGRAETGRQELASKRPDVSGLPGAGDRVGSDKRPDLGDKRPGADKRPELGDKRPDLGKKPAVQKPQAKPHPQVAARPAEPKRPAAARPCMPKRQPDRPSGRRHLKASAMPVGSSSTARAASKAVRR